MLYEVITLDGDDHFLFLDCSTLNPGCQADVQALFAKLAFGLFGDIAVCERQEVRQGFEQHDFAAEPIPDGAKLKADHAGPDYP